MLKRSISFLAVDARQIPAVGRYGNIAVEATLFGRQHLDDRAWSQAWCNIEAVARSYGPHNVSFHFPVDDSDYLHDVFVRDRLAEALRRANDMSLHGVVVHSNQVRRFADWSGGHLDEERRAVAEALETIRSQVSGTPWLALENMPVMDNHGREIDPLFVFPEDFTVLTGSGVGVVWDVCHYFSTLANIAALKAGLHDRAYYPNVRNGEPHDFTTLAAVIRHWHFSAFLGVAEPNGDVRCHEGVLPDEGTLAESAYVSAFKVVLAAHQDGQHVVFEVQEDSYADRARAPRILHWSVQPVFEAMEMRR